MNLEAFKHTTIILYCITQYVLGDNNVVKASKMGFIVVEEIMKDKINRIHIKYALYVFRVHDNLLSVRKFVSYLYKYMYFFAIE